MKKFLSLCTAATLSVSLVGAVLAADPADVAGYSSNASNKECASVKDDNDRIQCVRERQRQLLKQKMMRNDVKMTRKAAKMEAHNEWQDLRVSPRTLRMTVKAMKTKTWHKLSPSSSSAGSSM